MSNIIETTKNKPGRPKRDYNTKLVNFRLDTTLIELLNQEKNKTELVQNLIRNYYKDKENERIN